jgi:hypothetical protein
MSWTRKADGQTYKAVTKCSPFMKNKNKRKPERNTSE